MRVSEQVAAALESGGFAMLPGHVVFDVEGKDALDLLDRLSTNDLRALGPSQAVATAFLTPEGRLRHRVIVQRSGEGLRLIAAPGARESLPAWIDQFTFMEDCRVQHRSDDVVGLAFGGPVAEALRAKEPPLFAASGTCVRAPFGALDALYLCGDDAALLAWREASSTPELSALSAEALLQLRVEAGHGIEEGELADRHALEAGLEPIVSFNKGCYTGQEIVARQDSRQKIVRRFVGLVFEGSPKVGEVLSSEDKSNCLVTSVAPDSPAGLGASLPSGVAGLGFVSAAHALEGQAVELEGGGKGQVVLLPFPRFREQAS